MIAQFEFIGEETVPSSGAMQGSVNRMRVNASEIHNLRLHSRTCLLLGVFQARGFLYLMNVMILGMPVLTLFRLPQADLIHLAPAQTLQP